MGPNNHVLDGVNIGRIQVQLQRVKSRRCGLLPYYFGYLLLLGRIAYSDSGLLLHGVLIPPVLPFSIAGCPYNGVCITVIHCDFRKPYKIETSLLDYYILLSALFHGRVFDDLDSRVTPVGAYPV